MKKTMDIIKASAELERLYNLAVVMDREETERVINALDEPNPIMSDIFCNTDPAAKVRSELVRIIKANELLRNLTREGAVVLKLLLDKTSSTLEVSKNIWHVLTEEERIVHGYDIDGMWRAIHHEDLGNSANADNLFMPYFGDDMP